MAELRVAAEAPIAAPADRVYRILVDYRLHHPNILPPAFSDVTVEEGGVGAGTVIRYKITAGGRTRSYRMRVSEPDPGHILLETDDASSLATTFTVTPEGDNSRVAIETTWQGAAGFGGLMERFFAPRVLKGLYADELARLDRYARDHPAI
jgi:uncharacterized protein YndB with AHSA1/START domain